jgi:hypothetical protein
MLIKQGAILKIIIRLTSSEPKLSGLVLASVELSDETDTEMSVSDFRWFLERLVSAEMLFKTDPKMSISAVLRTYGMCQNFDFGCSLLTSYP